jgi:hypothetical protein
MPLAADHTLHRQRQRFCTTFGHREQRSLSLAPNPVLDGHILLAFIKLTLSKRGLIAMPSLRHRRARLHFRDRPVARRTNLRPNVFIFSTNRKDRQAAEERRYESHHRKQHISYRRVR